MNGPRCQFCNDPVRPGSKQTWHRVEGWERPGKAGGSDIVLRERTGEFACPRCVSRIRMGVNVQQETLV